jgi:hypothetical protein
VVSVAALRSAKYRSWKRITVILDHSSFTSLGKYAVNTDHKRSQGNLVQQSQRSCAVALADVLVHAASLVVCTAILVLQGKTTYLQLLLPCCSGIYKTVDLDYVLVERQTHCAYLHYGEGVGF